METAIEQTGSEKERNPLPLKYHLLVLGLVFAWCLVVALLSATQYYEAYTLRGEETSWWSHLKSPLAHYCLWLPFIPAILYLCNRFRFKRGAVLLPFVVHLLASPVFGCVKVGVQVFVLLNILGFREVSVGFGCLLQQTLMYWLFLAAFNGFTYYKSYRERALRASQLEGQLARAQLQVLKMQLHPHFLFNTLHAVSTLMRRDIEAADRMITRLSDLLRLSLENSGPQEVPLRKELDILRRYLDIEEIRFGDRLTVSFDIEPEVLDAYVPNFILQPVVENAVNHGISRVAADGRIGVHAAQRNGFLLMEVSDNGPGLPKGNVKRKMRTGLTNTIARLDKLYGPAGRVLFENTEGGGLTVRLEIPFHTSPSVPQKPAGKNEDQERERGRDDGSDSNPNH